MTSYSCLRNRAAGILTAIIITFIAFSNGESKSPRTKTSRSLDFDSTGTNNIQVNVGNGSGFEEDIMYETLLFVPHAEDLYSVYNAFLGVYFDNYYGEVQQSRFIDGSYNADGELTASTTDTMDYEEDIAGFRVAGGEMWSAVSATSDTMRVKQNSYIREGSDDAFIILEYTIYNNSDSLFTDGKVMMFSDFDVGDGIYDNLTGTDESLNLIYQYSDGDDYAGLSLIYPDTLPVQFGNFDDWFFNGSDNLIDTLSAHTFYSDTDTVYITYDTTFESQTGDYSVFAVAQLDTVQPWSYATVTFAFAIQENLSALQNEITTAKAEYVNNIFPLHADNPTAVVPSTIKVLSAYPNPFNASTIIELKLDQEAAGNLILYDLLGREVAVIHQGILSKGHHRFNFNAGEDLSSGIYLIRADFSENVSTEKIILLK